MPDNAGVNRQPNRQQNALVQLLSVPEFFALKKRLDSTNKFRNTLWDKFYQP